MVSVTSDRSRSQSNAARVFSTLRDDIIALRLAPRMVLSRAGLQERFGLSSTPIRDALMRLEEEGLVQIFPQHATVVSPIDLARAEQGQFLRRSVESEIVRTLAMNDRSDVVGPLHALIRRQKAFAGLSDYEAFTEADLAFHRLLYEVADVAALWPVVRRHAGHIDRLRRLHLPVPGKLAQIIHDHETIVTGIEQRDPSRAADALRDHLSRSLDFVSHLRLSHTEYF